MTARTLVLAAVLFLLFGCAPEEEKDAAVPAGTVSVLRLAGGDYGYPTPYSHYPRGPGGYKMTLLFDSLLERDEQGLIPWLAERWSVAADGLEYRFVIRQGVKWHDGTDLTVDDVVFSLNYALRHPPTWSSLTDVISDVVAEGNSVRVAMREPAATMLDAIGRTRIIPRHIWENVDRPKEFTTSEAVIGCGPFTLSDYSKEHGSYRFVANQNYWGPSPRVISLEFLPVSEPILAYEKGELDLIGVAPDLLSRFTAEQGNKIVRNPAFWGYRLLFNIDNTTVLRDVRVRRALAHAIDRSELVEKIERGAALPGSFGILPPDHLMAAKDTRDYPYDPQMAGQLLDEAGIVEVDGRRALPDSQPLSLTLICSSQEVRMAELLRARFAAVGIDLVIRSVDGKSRDARVRGGEYQLAIIGHGGWGQDGDYLTAHLAGQSFSDNRSPSAAPVSGMTELVPAEVLELLRTQQREVDQEKRRQMLGDIQRAAAELVPEIPLYYTAGWTVYRPATYDGWMNMFDHHSMPHSKLSYLERVGAAARR